MSPVLTTEVRVALTLRLLGGLTTDEIARVFLVPEPTVARRIVRAKRTLAEARVPFEVCSSAPRPVQTEWARRVLPFGLYFDPGKLPAQANVTLREE